MVPLQQRRRNPVHIMALGPSLEKARQRGADDGGGTWILMFLK